MIVFLTLAPGQAAAEIKVQWLGHATTRIFTDEGKVILIDPFLRRNPKTPEEFRDLKAFEEVDLILVTHGHIDHIADLVPIAKATGAPVVGPYELLRNLVAMEVLDAKQVVSLGKGGYAEPLGRGLRVHMVPAEHSSSVDLFVSDLRGKVAQALRHISGGEAVGYVIEFGDKFTLYHTGDTAVFGDMRLIGEFFAPDLVLACIGGTYTMGPAGAAYAMKTLIKPEAVIPIHYGTYPLINRTPDELIAELDDTEIDVIVPQPGEVLAFP